MGGVVILLMLAQVIFILEYVSLLTGKGSVGAILPAWLLMRIRLHAVFGSAVVCCYALLKLVGLFSKLLCMTLSMARQLLFWSVAAVIALVAYDWYYDTSTFKAGVAYAQLLMRTIRK